MKSVQRNLQESLILTSTRKNANVWLISRTAIFVESNECPTPWHLKRHITRMHSGEKKMYTCENEGCNASYAREHYLVTHMKKCKSGKKNKGTKRTSTKKYCELPGDNFTEFEADIANFTGLIDLSLLENYFSSEDNNICVRDNEYNNISATMVDFDYSNSLSEVIDQTENSVPSSSAREECSVSNNIVEGIDLTEKIVCSSLVENVEKSNNASSSSSVPLPRFGKKVYYCFDWVST